MKLSQRRYADTLVLTPAGRLDHDSCDDFDAELQPLVEEARDGRALVLDLSALEYVSSAGLRLLMLAGKQARTQGGRIMIAAMRPLVAEIFQISRFTMLFEIHPGVRDALTAASPQAAAAFDGR
jgi:anti-sigma B factor antagonist